MIDLDVGTGVIAPGDLGPHGYSGRVVELIDEGSDDVIRVMTPEEAIDLAQRLIAAATHED